MVQAEQEPLSLLYKRYRSELRAHVLRRLASREEAEDLVQEVFLRVHQASAIGHIEHPRAYLHQVAESVVTDYLRRTQRGLLLSKDLESLDEIQVRGGSPTPEEVVIGEETWRLLNAGITRLPRKVRQAIVLRKFEDLSYKEVGEAMGISSRTVEKHLARGMMGLRESVGIAV